MNLTAEIVDWRRRRAERPLPAVQVEHGPSVPGALLRLGAALAVAALLQVATALLPGLGWQWKVLTAALFALWTWVRPSPAPVHVATLVCAIALLAAPGGGFHPASLGLVVLVLLAVRLTWWAEHVATRTRVEVAALVRAGRRDATVLVVTLVLGATAWWVSGSQVGVLVVLGSAALLALAASLLGGSRR